MNHTTILKSPVMTEKSLTAAKHNRYTFLVSKDSNKHQIKEAVERFFKVKVVAVATSTLKGTAKKTGRRRLPGSTAASKKAVVTVKAGQTINVFEAKE